MRIGIIADVHGNLPALKAVLKHFEMRRDIDHIFCLGDMIAIGPDTNEVLEILFSREDVSMVTGNHDEAVLALFHDEEYPASHFHVKEHHQWVADHLDQDFAAKLGNLPRKIPKEINGHSTLLNHYHIAPSKLHQHISHDPFSSIVEPRLDTVSALFKNEQHDFICFGHHHPVHYFQNDQTIYLNPGSLGCNIKPTARFAVVTLDDENIEINLDEVAYDRTDFLLSYKILQVPERDFILNAFHGQKA